ncbi:glycosyltransferase family 4 protein [Winogradskyella sp.]|uniref:glycosyltransferase family 4 protein n=1 Tax=Winogradskyella sp. TaxID=1883156 RepID=UPI003F6BA66A
MKIGFVLPSTPNYSETFFNSKIKGLQKNGFNIVLFVRETRENFSLCRVEKMPKVIKNKALFFLKSLFVFTSLVPHFNKVNRFYKLEKLSGSSPNHILKKIYLNSHILKSKVDILHFGFATQAIGSESVAKAIGAKMAVSLRGFDINVYPLKNSNCYARLWENVDKVHSISKYLLNEAYKLGLNNKKPYQIITPAVIFEQINNLVDYKTEANKQITICTVARLNWIKNLSVAIELMSGLVKVYPNLTYQIIGGGNQKEKERYLFLIEQLGLQKNVVLMDKLSHFDVLSKIKNSDIYLQTSYNEGFCNAVLEAQALGCLTIASDVGGLKENIEHNKTGWLVYPIEKNAFETKILQVLQLPEFDKNIIKEAAQKRVKEKFTLEKQVKDFIDFYKF